MFDSQVYKVANQITPYEQYAIGKLASYRGIASELATTMQVLRRGRSKRADAFLDWLVRSLDPGSYSEGLTKGRKRARSQRCELDIFAHYKSTFMPIHWTARKSSRCILSRSSTKTPTAA